MSEQMSSALKIRFDCGCARLDPDYDPKDFVHYIRRVKKEFLEEEQNKKYQSLPAPDE